MKPGDILLVQGEGVLSDAIEFFTHGGFSHSGIISSEGTCIEALGHGVAERAIEYDRYAIYEVIGITDEERQKVIEAARSLIGTPYDYTQDLGFAINALRKTLGLPKIKNLFDEDHRLICSALVDIAFRSTGIILRPDLNPGDISPTGLTYSPKVHFLESHGIWEV
jgi:cell wall-associated NlpC family hydrolase